MKRLKEKIVNTPPNNPEFDRFTDALRSIVKVLKSEIQERIEAQKRTGKRLSKGAFLGFVVSSEVRSSIGNS
jgi:hypothetical protein